MERFSTLCEEHNDCYLTHDDYEGWTLHIGLNINHGIDDESFSDFDLDAVLTEAEHYQP